MEHFIIASKNEHDISVERLKGAFENGVVDI